MKPGLRPEPASDGEPCAPRPADWPRDGHDLLPPLPRLHHKTQKTRKLKHLKRCIRRCAALRRRGRRGEGGGGGGGGYAPAAALVGVALLLLGQHVEGALLPLLPLAPLVAEVGGLVGVFVALPTVRHVYPPAGVLGGLHRRIRCGGEGEGEGEEQG